MTCWFMLFVIELDYLHTFMWDPCLFLSHSRLPLVKISSACSNMGKKMRSNSIMVAVCTKRNSFKRLLAFKASKLLLRHFKCQRADATKEHMPLLVDNLSVHCMLEKCMTVMHAALHGSVTIIATTCPSSFSLFLMIIVTYMMRKSYKYTM